ncbi:MAG: glycosyltransferase family 2 protein, partial [Phycisphaerae bacterium]
MNPFYMVWLSLCVLTALVWMRRHLDLSQAQRGDDALGPDPCGRAPKTCPSVSVIVAAKDEESTIERCVLTLLEQDYPNFRLIVVDDRSSDHTADILDALQRRFPDRMRVLHVTKLPDGWFGKTNAVNMGVHTADGDFLLFTDADCEQVSDRTISTAVRYALENRIEFLSILPLIKPHCMWEAFLQPACTGVLMFWHQPDKVNDPKRPEAYANGAFMLIDKDAYQRIGGHQRVRSAICEDMQLARNAKTAGVKLRVIQGRGLYATRMYNSFHETFCGWTRILQGSLQWAPKVLLAAALLTVFSIFPMVSLVAAGVGWAGSSPQASAPWGWIFAASLVSVAALQSVMARFYGLLQAPAWRSIFYTPAAVFCLAILMNTLVRVLGVGSTTWRGTVYHRSKAQRTNPTTIEKPATHTG